MNLATNQTPTAPKLRGWFHLGAVPVVFVASLVLFLLSENSIKFAVGIYGLTALTLFSVSAIYHRVPWQPKAKALWRRWDHANINLLIAGTYTPFAVTLLDGNQRRVLLTMIWIGALFGVAMRMLWLRAPRWLYVGNYIVLGWAAIIYLPELYNSGGLTVLIPIVLGGLLYSIGAIFYALKAPGRNAKYFGFHELFHIFVLGAWASQYIGVFIAVWRNQ